MDLRRFFCTAFSILIISYSPLSATDKISNYTGIADFSFYLTPADEPTITDGPTAVSRHAGNDRGDESYTLNFHVIVSDPQGPGDIASVVVTGPTGITYQLSDPEIDGSYDSGTPDTSDPPPLGTYVFKITDNSGNWIEATDNIDRVLDYPKNVVPSHYGVTENPIFQWDAVTDAISYTIDVADVNGSQIWTRNNLTSNLVIYNYDATATTALVNGNTYNWIVTAYDADGNWSQQYYWVAFIYSTNNFNPILNNANVKSAHYGDDYGNQEYVLQLGIQAADPQGFSDIASVKVTGTGGSVYQLTDSDNDGYYDGWFSGLSSPPQSGNYIFRATDLSGNWTEKVEMMTGSLDYPKNVHPSQNEVITTSSPAFSWDAVVGSAHNEIWVDDINGKRIWGRSDLPGSSNSVVFNNDGYASEALKDGAFYTWIIKAVDDNGNWGEHYSRSFAYSSNVSKPFFGNHNAITYHGGDDTGNEDWGYDFYAYAADPQGLSDIASVSVIAPGGVTCTLTDPDNDGRYDGDIRNLTSSSLLGECQFTVTDKSGNTATLTDTLYAWVDFARNTTPTPNEVVSTGTPMFSWDAVNGISYYQLHVRIYNGPTVWGGVNITSGTSVTYNYNGTGQSLIKGTRYAWDLYTFDSKGNYGYHYQADFVYSSNDVSPILTNPVGYSAHYGNDSGDYYYQLNFSTQAADPQGVSDITSVIVTGPDLKTYILKDNNNNGYFDGSSGGTKTLPATGIYKFRVTDSSGNWTELTYNINAIQDYPKNVKPAHGGVISTSTPTFTWDPVPNSVRNDIWVNDSYGKWIWGRNDMAGSSTSVVFNDDGRASEVFKDGSIYSWTIRAIDVNGNWGEHYSCSFAYSSNTEKPIIGNHDATTVISGDDFGNQDRGYDFWVEIIDPQGLADISSVSILAPDGITYTLSDPENDGRYYSGPRSIASPFPLGQCQFTVTDKSGNIATVLDTLFNWVDFAHNTKPVHNEFVASDPVFMWDIVSGVYYYQIHVWIKNGSVIWGGINVYDNSPITYNYNGTGQPLTDGSRYEWDIRTFDAKGNYGYHYGGEFIYSTSTTNPILSNLSAHSAHFGDDEGNERYYLSLSAQPADPQGMSDIASVIVTGPDLKTFTLTDSNGDGVWDGWFGGTTTTPALGNYTFRVVDKSGNWKEATDNVTAILNYPRNLKPKKNEVVSTSTPVFSWNPVSGVTSYTIWINDIKGRQVWWRNITDTSVVYNDNWSASESLKNGSAYIIYVEGSDDNGNYGQHDEQIFYYSTNLIKPIITGYQVRSRHWANGDFRENWGIDSWANVSDPQGLDDIDSVWVEGPGNLIIKLYDDNTNGDGTANDSRFENWQGGLDVPPPTGEYIFKAVDKSGNLAEMKDTLTALLDYPKNLNVAHNSIVTEPDFTISWDKVAGATRYEVSVNSSDWNTTYWNSGRIPGLTTISYNADNNGIALEDGEVYNLTIRTDDGDNGNESERTSVRFAFRSNMRKIIYVDTSNQSGTENGTPELPYNTLRKAIYRSVPSDTIIVASGIYDGNIDDLGSLTLIGENPQNTIIRGYIALRSPDVVIRGFRICESDGAGIEVHENVNVEISNNIISDNPGAGILIGWNESSTAIIKNNTIVRNGNAGVAVETNGSEVTITGNIIAYNNYGIRKNPEPKVFNSYNDFFSNSEDLSNLEAGEGDIFDDPGFNESPDAIYELTASSPCLDAADPDPDGDGFDWVTDPDDRDPDTTRMDMGAVFLDQRLLVPDSPTGLVSASCNDLLTLKWKRNPGPYFLRYIIYGGSDADPLTKIDSTSADIADTSIVISGLTHGQSYYFRIAAMNRGGMLSDYSSQTSSRIQTGVIPRIKSKWSGDILICYNLGDSITKFQWMIGGLPVTSGTGQFYITNRQSGTYSVETIDWNGCKNISQPLTVSGGNSISAWPNPASYSLTVRISNLPEGSASISIINSNGSKVMEFQAENTDGEILREVQVSGLEDGIYYINVTDSNKESYSSKIVISK